MTRPVPVLVSRCLTGEPCRYDGRAKPAVTSRFPADRVRWITVCPEKDGGLPVPRPPCEIEAGATAADVLAGRARVLTREGREATREYVRGALLACEAALATGAKLALLKARSPSCSPCGVYDGSFSGTLTPGRGIAAEALDGAGLGLFSEEELDRLEDALNHLK